MALAAVAAAGPIDGRSVHGGDRSADAARTRAEIERKSRDIKKKVADQQRDVRQRLNLPDPTGAAARAPSAKPNPSPHGAARQSGGDPLSSNLNRPDPRAVANKSRPGRQKMPVEYSPRRGQEFAFLVEMSTHQGGVHQQWIGTPYFTAIFSDVGRSFAEMLCIGNLACRIRSSPDRPWVPAPLDDIELPQRFMFGPHGVLNTETTGLFDEHTLPVQLSAILPLEELIFPRLPIFSDGPKNESTTRTRFYLRGGQKDMFGIATTTDLDGEFRRKSSIEEENSTNPRIVNERTFHCDSPDVGLSFPQVGSMDAGEGMIVNVDLDYLLELGEDVRLTAKVRRLSGSDLEAARTVALKKLPPADWPAYFKRIPAESDRFGLRLPRSEDDIPLGQPISVSIQITERDARGSRDYLAQAISGAPQGKIRVRLEGSQEELNVSPSSVRLPK
jgi:hypothetical protein